MFQVCLVCVSLFSSLLWEMQDSGVVKNFQFDPKPWTHVRINFNISNLGYRTCEITKIINYHGNVLFQLTAKMASRALKEGFYMVVC